MAIHFYLIILAGIVIIIYFLNFRKIDKQTKEINKSLFVLKNKKLALEATGRDTPEKKALIKTLTDCFAEKELDLTLLSEKQINIIHQEKNLKSQKIDFLYLLKINQPNQQLLFVDCVCFNQNGNSIMAMDFLTNSRNKYKTHRTVYENHENFGRRIFSKLLRETAKNI